MEIKPKPLYTSRSAVEAYQDCPRYRFLQFHMLGQGLVSIKKSVPLVTGGTVHRGIEHLLNRVRIGEEPDVETAVQLAITEYVNTVEAHGFTGKIIKSDRQHEFTYQEQKALAEALIRAWYIAELPKLVKRYKVLAVERDIVPLEIGEGILFQAKVDAEFQTIAEGDYHNYSVKTAKQWGDKEEMSYKQDLQGITEIWAVEEDWKRRQRVLNHMINSSDVMFQYDRLKQYLDIKGFLEKKLNEGKQISGVRFCILIKGKMYKNENYENSMYATYSPLIRGYKKITPSGIEYAHSWRFPNPENKSGFSNLGVGWEPFNAWEGEWTIKKWMDLLASGEIQPTIDDIIKQQVVTPVEYFRNDREVEIGIREMIAQERKIRSALVVINGDKGSYSDGEVHRTMELVFPHFRKHCNFHFGGECEYKPLCWDNLDNEKLKEMYDKREPHHEAERSSLE